MRGSEVIGRSNATRLGTLVLVGAVAFLAAPAIKRMARRWNVTHPQAKKEPAIDDSLNDTYPASDPPASRYFDIPVNRR